MQNGARTNSKVAQAPSTAVAVPLPPGGRLKLVHLGRAINDRPYDVGVLCGGDFADRRGRRSLQGIASWAYFTLGSLR